MPAPIGTKLRQQRKLRGLLQADLARAAGISPSYLNLIENDKRQVGGALLLRIASELGIEVEELSGEKEQRLLDELSELLSDPVIGGVKVEPGQLHDLVAQLPTVAQALHRLYRGYVDASASVETFANRLKSDPLLSRLLHQILSHVTAVRSSGEIIRSVPDLSRLQQHRFLDTIDREARSLSDLARALIAYFDQSVRTRPALSPVREVDDLIIGENNYFPRLEDAAASLRAEIEAAGDFGEATLTQLLAQRFAVQVQVAFAAHAGHEGLSQDFGFNAEERVVWFQRTTSMATRQFQLTRLLAELTHGELIDEHVHDRRLTTASAQRIAYRALASYVAGATVFPYSRFLGDAQTHQYDIDRLRQAYAASFEQVAHRLVTLRRPNQQGIPFGFLRADPAGRLTKHFPLPGLQLANTGHACPLWVIYAAAHSPGQILRQVVQFPDGARYLFLGRATPRGLASYHAQPFHSSVMLACDLLHADRMVYGQGLKLDDPALDVPVGPTCRLCIRRECEYRQEEALDVFGERPNLRLPLVPRDFPAPDPDPAGADS
ncbi:short-chain fatty acyl-CoA regulator family protein [Ottowia sp.]|uniref:helix-turn-helix domain-containing protein n=1 Tax=Ottowia sp. TaxID=1898956 RepID=UPI002CAD7E82|nr:short-chain fatty acyl-CoA regulator family protein [Ottowia sp.]HRN76897.1 short-chain fatty acyl-CoA regulator family protein [Ottowia sp.]